MFGWIKSLFGQRSANANGAAHELDGIMGKVLAFLKSDELQNQQMPELLRSLMSDTPSNGMLPGGSGTFGFSPSNPVLVNGPIGEVLYLSKLVSNQGQQVFAHRLGSKDTLDVYETVTFDGERWDLIWLSPYWRRKSNVTPQGFNEPGQLKGRLLLTATNEFVAEFPHQIGPQLRKFSQEAIGFPIVPITRVSQILGSNNYQRPESHRRKVEALNLAAVTR